VPDGLLVQGDIGDAALLNRPSGGNPGLRSKLPGAPGATGSNKKVMKVLYSRLGVSLLTALCCRAGGRALPGALHA